MLARCGKFLRGLGPGLITGASDDDPSGIATYSQAGARYGHGMLWTLVFSLPFMSAVQEISARLGRVTGRGIAANARAFYPRWMLCILVGLLFSANTINLGADLAAMAEAVRLLIGGPALIYAAFFASVSAALEVWVPYTTYARYLKWATLVLFSYVGTLFFIQVDWGGVVRHTLIPTLTAGSSSLTTLIAVLGTTISPYLLFWQSSEEVENIRCSARQNNLRANPWRARSEFRRIRWDTWVGMTVSNLVAFIIILSVAETLHRAGITEIETAAQAAEALRPLAGPYAYLLFSLGIVGTGLLAVPVLAGSSAFAVGELFGWPEGLEKKPGQAKGFYITIALGFVLGWLLSLLGVNPVKALFWSAVLNGLISVPILAALMRMATSRTFMGPFCVSGTLRAMGWATTAIMLLACVAFVVSTLR